MNPSFTIRVALPGPFSPDPLTSRDQCATLMLAKIAEWTDAVCDMASTPAEKQAAETVLTATCDMIGAVSMGIAYGVDNMPNPDLLLKGLFEIADHFVPAGYCIGMEDRRLGVYPLMRQSISTRNGKPIIQ